MGQQSQTSCEDSLTVRDNRTGRIYTIPYVESPQFMTSRGLQRLSFHRITDNAIPATAFKALKAPRKPGEREENETEKGLRVQDKGFLNTAVMSSTITYIDGEAGGSSAFTPCQWSHLLIHMLLCKS